MKLIPLSEYVEKEYSRSVPTETAIDELAASMRRVINYTKFLRQPLTLGMFVPVCGDGKPYDLNEVEAWKNHKHYSRLYKEELAFFEDAKERVLFEGFDLEWQSKIIIGVKNDFEVSIAFDKKTGLHGVKQNVEWLCSYGLPLTASALKLIGVKE
ncbi:hypothetical protein FY557_17415 [Chryseobacterium sp. SN22]|uniref:hypothetical protein n=1 Tax=Chryseobacterium sp. SN22 TaxID=2606431 RepID=UPI0011EF2221|nr:hypothetical protein [Chryseobacterium sp. SN22]KAA0126429.1 hypothetical protein FY557_17415 [Chryseobacterium sp. SN22]